MEAKSNFHMILHLFNSSHMKLCNISNWNVSIVSYFKIHDSKNFLFSDKNMWRTTLNFFKICKDKLDDKLSKKKMFYCWLLIFSFLNMFRSKVKDTFKLQNNVAKIYLFMTSKLCRLQNRLNYFKHLLLIHFKFWI